MDIQEMRSNLAKLPIQQQEEMLALLEKNISNEYEKMADAALKHDLKIVEERLKLYDSGAMPAYAWQDVMQELFPEA